MHVEIDDQRAADSSLSLKHADGDRDIVEDAEAGAVVRECVVATAGCAAGDAVIEGEACGQHGSAHRGLRAEGHRGRQGNANAPGRRGRQRLAEHTLDVAAIVNALEPGLRRRLGLDHPVAGRQAVLDQHLDQAGKLGSGEATRRV